MGEYHHDMRRILVQELWIIRVAIALGICVATILPVLTARGSWAVSVKLSLLLVIGLVIMGCLIVFTGVMAHRQTTRDIARHSRMLPRSGDPMMKAR